MSDTPRTDAEMVKSCHENNGEFLAEDMMFFARELERELAELERENARLQMELDASCNAEELRQYRHANQFLITNQGAYERENAQMKRVVGLARDAVESGAVDECYLSLLRDAVSALPNAQVQRRPAPEPSTTCDDHGRSL